jgi:threonine/homoserine/homoserine lactone efflux protein
MANFLPPLPLLSLFLLASLVLALTPGPAVVYIVARTLSQGRVGGFASALGVALGNLGNAVGATLGLAALFAASAAAFTVVKWTGALYLLWLGLGLWRNAGRAGAGTDLPPTPARPPRQVMRDGFWVALLNPKTTLFFAAFLPQFLGHADHVIGRSLTLGAGFTLIALATDVLYVTLAARLAPRLGRLGLARQWGQRGSGTVFIGLGLLTALSDAPSP